MTTFTTRCFRQIHKAFIFILANSGSWPWHCILVKKVSRIYFIFNDKREFQIPSEQLIYH